MNTVRVNDKVTIKKTNKTAIVAWIDESKDNENYLLEIEDSNEMPKFYNREDFETAKKDQLFGLDTMLKDKQEDIAVQLLKKKLKSCGFEKDEIRLTLKALERCDNYLSAVNEMLQFFKDKNTKNKEEIVQELSKIIKE